MIKLGTTVKVIFSLTIKVKFSVTVNIKSTELSIQNAIVST